MFFYYITPKGREEKYWAKCNNKLDKVLFDKGAMELEIQVKRRAVHQKCINYAKRMLSKKNYSKFHVAKVVSEKFKNELSEVNSKLELKSQTFKSA